MSDGVNARRRYDASGRQEQARLARVHVLTVARDMFLGDGYQATTVPAVARAAGVSVQSVYKAFGSKAALVKAIFDVAIAGDDGPQPVLERESLTAVRKEPDPYVKLALYARFVADTMPRHGPIQLLIRAAATTDIQAAELWDQLSMERLTGMSMFAHDLRPQLRDGIAVDTARDILWATNSVEFWDLLVRQRGWSTTQYANHLADNLTHALLPPRPPFTT
jgi:AcrR family transcriptional regulator